MIYKEAWLTHRIKQSDCKLKMYGKDILYIIRDETYSDGLRKMLINQNISKEKNIKVFWSADQHFSQADILQIGSAISLNNSVSFYLSFYSWYRQMELTNTEGKHPIKYDDTMPLPSRGDLVDYNEIRYKIVSHNLEYDSHKYGGRYFVLINCETSDNVEGFEGSIDRKETPTPNLTDIINVNENDFIIEED